MYRLYILCVMSVVVFGNSDEAKYIDLLPEVEKQEFLNRIARRIIEEIQGKNAPEQSHAEVSDDQLNAHHAYVEDLIKEESQNLRNERRNYNTNENVDRKDNNDGIEKDNIAQGHNDPGNNENSQHIDLTLRNGRSKEKKQRPISDDSKFSVIPVKVVYEQDDVKSTQSPTNSPQLSDEVIIDISERKESTNTGNHSVTELENTPPPLAQYPKEKENANQTNLKMSHNSQILDEQSTILLNTGVPIFESSTQKLNDNLERNSSEIQFTTDTNLVTDFSKTNENYDDSFENTENYTKSINISRTGTDVHLSNNITSLLPLTTEFNIESSSKYFEQDPALPTVYVTTVKSTQHIKNEFDVVVNKTHEDDVNETKKNIRNNINKKYLRERLEILSEENKFNKEALVEHKPMRYKNKNKNIKQYFVYEIPKEKPVFKQKKNLKENKEPYVVPIYNFAPENAYFNAYNHFGVNNDEEHKAIKKKYPIDKELYMRSGFKIDLRHKSHTYRNGRRGQSKYKIKHPRHPHWEHILNSKFEYPKLNEYQDNENFRRKFKRDSQFNISRNESDGEFAEEFKIPLEIVYIPLRKRDEDDDEEATLIKKLKSFYIGTKLSHSNNKDEARAAKTYLLQQEKFAYLLPPKDPSKDDPEFKRKLAGDGWLDESLEINNDEKEDNGNEKSKIIELDYYFGKNNLENRRETDDYNDDSDSKDISEQQDFYDLTNKKHDYHVKRHRIGIDDDCKHGCIEMNLQTANNFGMYQEALVNVLKDMIYRDKPELVNYDWLLSTIDVDSALGKLKYLIKTVEQGNTIHPLDLELLNYVIYLYSSSSYKLENTTQSSQEKAVQDINKIVKSFLNLLRRRIILPKSKKNKHGTKLKNPTQFFYKFHIRDGSRNDIWSRKTKMLRHFKIFLKELEENLGDFHRALKHIAVITKYRDQNWYGDLKNIYLKSASKKQLLQVILHLAASRLFSSVEKTAKNAETDEFYANHNAELVSRIQEEFIFVLRIIEWIKKTNY